MKRIHKGHCFRRDSKAMAMKVVICLGVCNNPLADLLHCECARRPVIPIIIIHNPPITKNVQHNWVTMGENTESR